MSGVKVGKQGGKVYDADRRQGAQGDGAADGPAGGVDGVFGRAGGVEGCAGAWPQLLTRGGQVTPAGPRTNKSAPSSRSRALIVADTPDWTTCSLTAAWVKLRVSATAKKCSRWRSSTQPLSLLVLGPIRRFRWP